MTSCYHFTEEKYQGTLNLVLGSFPLSEPLHDTSSPGWILLTVAQHKVCLLKEYFADHAF